MAYRKYTFRTYISGERKLQLFLFGRFLTKFKRCNRVAWWLACFMHDFFDKIPRHLYKEVSVNFNKLFGTLCKIPFS